MRSKMDPDVRLYNVPHSEVVYSYKGEEENRTMHDGKYIVEMDKPRPEWFPKNLLTRGHGKHWLFLTVIHIVFKSVLCY